MCLLVRLCSGIADGKPEGLLFFKSCYLCALKYVRFASSSGRMTERHLTRWDQRLASLRMATRLLTRDHMAMLAVSMSSLVRSRDGWLVVMGRV